MRVFIYYRKAYCAPLERRIGDELKTELEMYGLKHVCDLKYSKAPCSIFESSDSLDETILSLSGIERISYDSKKSII